MKTMGMSNATMAALLIGPTVAVRAQPRDHVAKYAGATTGKKHGYAPVNGLKCTTRFMVLAAHLDPASWRRVNDQYHVGSYPHLHDKSAKRMLEFKDWRNPISCSCETHHMIMRHPIKARDYEA
jgi:hypothetical protein